MYDTKEDTELLQARKFPKLTLGAIFFFSRYAEADERLFSKERKSFRAFTEATNRSHRLMVKIVDRIEYQMQRLLIERTYRHADGEMYRVADYQEAVELKKQGKGKRVGTLTRYGKAWRQFAEHMADLYDAMIEIEDDRVVQTMLREQRQLLAQHRLENYQRTRNRDEFEGL